MSFRKIYKFVAILTLVLFGSLSSYVDFSFAQSAPITPAPPTPIIPAEVECTEDPARKDAETACPFYFDFYTGIELIGKDGFSKSLPRFGIRSRWEIISNGEDPPSEPNGYSTDSVFRLNMVINAAFTAKNIEQAEGEGQPKFSEAEKVFEYRSGFLIDFLDFYKNNKPTYSLGLLLEMGFIDFTEKGNAGEERDLSQNHFGGFRLVYKKPGKFNGARLDAGWGASERFFENENLRAKTRLYVPYRLFDGSNTKIFAAAEADGDFDDGGDETKLIFGISIPLNSVGDGFRQLLGIPKSNTTEN